MTLLAKWKTTLQLTALAMELVVAAWGAFGLPTEPHIQNPAIIAAHTLFWIATVVTLITGRSTGNRPARPCAADGRGCSGPRRGINLCLRDQEGPMRNRLSIGAGLAAVTMGLAGAAWADEPVRCTTDSLGAETCRYADGTTTRRSTDKLGYETFRDRDGSVSRRKVEAGSNYVEVNGRGKVVERCRDDGKGHIVCRRGPP